MQPEQIQSQSSNTPLEQKATATITGPLPTAITAALPESRTQAVDNAALMQHVFGGQSPNLTQLIDRPVSSSEQLTEYRAWLRRGLDQHVPHPIAGLIMLGEAAVSFFDLGKRRHFARNDGGIREWFLQEDANDRAFAAAGSDAFKLLCEGKPADALLSVGSALSIAPHREIDVYAAIADLSLSLNRWVKMAREGNKTLHAEISESSALDSPLYGSKVELIRRPERCDLPLSSSGLVRAPADYDTSEYEAGPVERGLKECDLPLPEIARAAHRRLHALVSDAEAKNHGATSSHNFSQAYKKILEGKIRWLEGDFEGAIHTHREALAVSDDHGLRNTVRDVEPLVWALSDAGLHDQALEEYGKAMQHPYPPPSESVYLNLLSLADKVASQNPAAGVSKWQLALPYIKAVADEEVRAHEMIKSWQAAYYLAKAVDAAEPTSHSEPAQQAFATAARVLRGEMELLEGYEKQRFFQRMRAAVIEAEAFVRD